MNWKYSLPSTLVAISLGILLSISFRTTEEIKKQQFSSAQRYKTFIKVLNQAETKRTKLQKEVKTLQDQIDHRKSGPSTNPNTAKLDRQVNNLKILSGEAAVTGPGVVVDLDDREATGTLIYSGDLKDIINILRYAGAEAMAINDQRIVANTAIHEAGRNLLVNKVPINRANGLPYEIVAIGDADKLDNYLQVTYGLVPDLRSSGVKVTITKQDKVNIPAYTGGSPIKLAQPLSDKQ